MTLAHSHKNCEDQEMLQIEWKQKHKGEHGTLDKKKFTPPFIEKCPLFDGFFLSLHQAYDRKDVISLKCMQKLENTLDF